MSTQLSEMFDPSSVAPSTGGGGQLPISDKKMGHLVIIVDDEIKQTNSGDGSYLALTLQITEGPSAGETGVFRLNLNNLNHDACRIAYQQLSSICHAVGQLSAFQDVSLLHNRPFRVTVDFQKGGEEKGYTEVKKILDVHGNPPGQQASTAHPAQAAPAPAPAPVQAAPAPAPAAPAAPPAPATQGFPPPQAPAEPQQQVSAVQDFPYGQNAPQAAPAAPPVAPGGFPQQAAPQPPAAPPAPAAPGTPPPNPAAAPWAQ